MTRLGTGFAMLALALVVPATGHGREAYQPGGAAVARTDKSFGGGKDEFHFVVVGDRTGAHRPGVFEEALETVDRLRPDFVINIGDLIEGNTEDRTTLAAEWNEITATTGRLSVPFFYVPGNHDLTNAVQLDEWRRRLGSPWYSFSYKGVLFLVLDTEDPPQPQISRRALMDEYGADAMGKVIAVLRGDPMQAAALFARDSRLAELAGRMRDTERVAFSAAQVAMVRDALRLHPHARWTFVLMHRPAWKVDSPAFREIEALLAGRDYTVLAGHFHKYEHAVRSGRDYIQLGVTGGMPGAAADDPAGADQVMWVSVGQGAPQITGIRLDGVFAKQGPAQDAVGISSRPEPASSRPDAH